MSIVYRYDKNFSGAELLHLFHTVGWCKGTSEDLIYKAMQNSSHIVTAWVGGTLVGLVRSMDDSCWSANIDCLVVHKDFQKRGIGTGLISNLKELLKHIETISVSPNEHENIGFYQKMGFTFIEGAGLLQIYNDVENCCVLV